MISLTLQSRAVYIFALVSVVTVWFFESFASTLEVLLGAGGITSIFTTASAIIFLIFTLLYTPCVAAIAAVKRELNGRWAWIMVISQCSVAWVISFIASLILRLIGIM